MLDFLRQPWPWYVAGPLIGLMVPLLLIIGNKSLGISSSLRHICAACFPARIPFFQYNWRRESWNLFFVLGIVAGGILAGTVLSNQAPLTVNPSLQQQMQGFGITDLKHLLPKDLVDWDSLVSIRGLIVTVIGGFLVGFGTRYAGGCTSGHTIMGLSTLQFPSIVATMCFMAGGFFTANILLPMLLKL